MKPDISAPLAGRRILITRAAHQAESLARRIRALGGEPVLFPCLALQCLPDAIRQAGAEVAAATDIAFTSANGAACVARHAPKAMLAAMRDKRLAAVGQRTAQALARAGLPPAHTAPQASQQGLIALYDAIGWPERLVFFRAEEGGDALPQAVRAHGGECRLVPAYRMACPSEDAAPVRAMLDAGSIDAVLLGSARCARHYAWRIGDPALASRAAIVTISEQAARGAREAGLRVDIVAPRPDFDAMLAALAAHIAKEEA